MENTAKNQKELLSEITSLKKQLADIKKTTSKEIAELKKRNKYQVHAEKEIFRKISNHTRDIYFELDMSGEILYISPGVERTFGVKQEDFLIQKLSSSFLGENGKDLKDSESDLKDLGEKEGESRVVTKSGKEIWVYYYVRYVEHEGHELSIVGIMYDVTQKKKTEQDLVLNTTYYNSLLQTTSDAIVIANSDWTILFASPVTYSLFGYQADSDLQGRSLFGFLDQNDRERAKEGIEKMLKGKKYDTMSCPEIG